MHAGLQKPILRGWLHVAAFAALAALGLTMIGLAEATPAQRSLLAIYLLGVLAMFGVSALYHRREWSPAALAVMRRLDHSTIFLAIAGTYTPVAAICLDGWFRPAVLGTVWGGAAVGILLQWLPVHVPRTLFTAVYV